jgi:hypothetical protein
MLKAFGVWQKCPIFGKKICLIFGKELEEKNEGKRGGERERRKRDKEGKRQR